MIEEKTGLLDMSDAIMEPSRKGDGYNGKAGAGKIGPTHSKTVLRGSGTALRTGSENVCGRK